MRGARGLDLDTLPLSSTTKTSLPPATELQTAAAPAPASGSLAGGPSPSHRSAHIQRGALHLSKAEKEDRETSNVFRVIAQQLRAHRSLYGHAMATARDAFRLIDKDGSKTLDHAEFREALHRLDIELTEAQVDEVLTVVDTDGDGVIEFDEFVSRESHDYR